MDFHLDPEVEEDEKLLELLDASGKEQNEIQIDIINANI